MRNGFRWMLLAAGCAGSALAADAPPRRLQGLEPACRGTLVVAAATLDWQVPGSRCLKRPYRVLEHDGGGDRRPTLFELPPRDADCRHELLELRPPAPGQANWTLLAYPTVADHRARAFDRALACTLKPLP